jgi:hypothetical protein
MSNDPIKIEQCDNATLILINRPSKHNALSPSLLYDLTAVISEAPSSKNLILASPAEIFCSGLDIDDLNFLWDARSELDQYFELLHTLYIAIYTHPASTMAIVRKGAFGGGFGLACCCDLILARKDSRFILPGNQFGNLARLARPPIMTKFQWVKPEDVTAIELIGESEPIFEVCDGSMLIPPFSNFEAFFSSNQSGREKRLARNSQQNFVELCKKIKTLVLDDLDPNRPPEMGNMKRKKG